MKTGIELITEERARQVRLGFDATHDDMHTKGEIAKAAGTYLKYHAVTQSPLAEMHKAGLITNMVDITVRGLWPWDFESFRPSDDPVRNLVKAGAMIAAEIDRLNRKGGS